jgi:hypothetical protein
MTRDQTAQLLIQLAQGVVRPLLRRSCLNDYCGAVRDRLFIQATRIAADENNR